MTAPVVRVASNRQPFDPSLTTWLRAVLWGAFLIPVAAFVAAVIWGYDRAYREAEASIEHASALALRQARTTFQISKDVALRVDQIAEGSAEDVRTRESEIHQRLADIALGLPSIVNINVWDALGQPLARSDLFPVNREATVADRVYFREQMNEEQMLGISDVLIGRQTGRELFNVTMRRHPGRGTFDGLIAVSLSPEFFRDYYRSLVADEPNLTAFALIRTDGLLLARWPAATDGRTKVESANPVMQQVASGVDSALIVLPPQGSRDTRLVSLRRVPGVPVYVAAGVDRASMLAGWFRFVGVLAAVFIPVTIGLVYVSWVALRKMRVERQLSAEVREEMARRAQAERAALETQKLEALSQLTGGVAHDFNNLLTIISNNLHILRRRHPAIGETRQTESIARAVASGVRLTRQLLSFSRKQALRPETVQLQQWLPAAEGLIASTLGSKIRLAFDVDAATLPITVDLAELELALINTALNAQHAMPQGGTLRITARTELHERSGDRAMVVIRVEDTGTGIAPELIGKVFEPFLTTKGAGKGSGLGLSQVSGLCDQAGGFATVSSEPGNGTTIAMFFPAAAPMAIAAAPEDPAIERTIAGFVLLVEDNAEVASVIEHLLQTAGLEVLRAANADDAYARVEAGSDRFDVVLSDITMPGSMDGIEFAFAVRKHWPALPVLLMTGYAERINEALHAGLRVLSKPVPPHELLGEIARLIAVRRSLSREVLDPAMARS